MPLKLILLLVASHVAFGGSRFILNLQAQRLGATEFQLGCILGLMMAVPVLLAVPVGRWSDRAGYARPTACGVLLAVAGVLVGAASWQLAPLFLVSILVGSGYMAGHVAISNAIGRVAHPDRVTHAYAALATGFSLSGMTGPVLAGVLMDHAGAHWAFLAMAAFLSVSALLLHASQRGEAVRWPQPAGGAAAPRGLALFRHPPLQRVFIASALLTAGADLFVLVVPLHGTRAGLSATAMGLVMGAFSAGMLAIRLMMPRLTLAFTAWTIVTGVLVVTALGYFVLPQLPSLALLLPTAFIMGASLGCGQPLSMTMLYHASPPGRAGEAVGIRSSITSASQTFLPMGFGLLGSTLGISAIFWATALLLALGAGYTHRTRPA